MNHQRFESILTGSDVPSEEPLLRALDEKTFFSKRGTILGVLLTLLVHFVAIFLIPSDLFEAKPFEVKDPYEEFSVEIMPDVVEEEEPEPEEFYTQTNPDAPDNPPDETDRFAARDQQAANEKKAEELDPNNRPASESEDDIDTDQFLSGELEPTPMTPPPGAEALEDTLAQDATPASNGLKKAVPLFSELPEFDLEEEGIKDHNFDLKDEDATDVTELFEGEDVEGEDVAEKTEEVEETTQVTQSRGVPTPSPRPRPKLPKVAPGPVRNSTAGVSNTGSIGVDAKFSEFGEYLERLIEVVSIRWNTLADQSAANEKNSMVKLKFTMRKDGEIENIELLDSTAKFIGISICRTAIQSGSPYGEWTAEMVETLGDEEEVTFAFHYR